MVTNRTLLVLLASVVITLVGCHEPTGLPNEVRMGLLRHKYCH